MSRPIVAIVGRPNVGKSTLFNSLAGQRISIVKDTPGVTRDRIYTDVTWLDREFTVIDTGGIEPDSSDIILSQMREQAMIAMETADVIIFMTDVRQGLVDSDMQVANMLRKSSKPVVLAVNKVDNFLSQSMDVYEFYNLGIGEPYPISAEGKQGLGDLLDAVISHFPEGAGTEETDENPKIAIVGKPNVGKSSIINKLLGKNRVIVSDIAGTTRDAIDTVVKFNDKELTLYRRDTVGFVYQFFNLINDITVFQNVILAPGSRDKEKAMELLKRVGLEGKEGKFPRQLSGGQQQRVAIARALNKNSEILLCDEPTGALDDISGKQVLKLLEEIHNEGKTIVLVTHTEEIAGMANRIITMKNGVVVKEEENKNIVKAEEVVW